MNINKGDKVTVLHSPYVWKVVHIASDFAITLSRNGGDPRNTRRTFSLSDILNIVERAKTADDFRRLAQESAR